MPSGNQLGAVADAGLDAAHHAVLHFLAPLQRPVKSDEIERRADPTDVGNQMSLANQKIEPIGEERAHSGSSHLFMATSARTLAFRRVRAPIRPVVVALFLWTTAADRYCGSFPSTPLT